MPCNRNCNQGRNCNCDAAKFLRCIADPARASLCQGCTTPLTCSGMSDEVDARIREWELRRVEAARMGVCSHQVPEPEADHDEGPGLLRSRWFWVGGALSAAFSLSLGAFLAAKGWL